MVEREESHEARAARYRSMAEQATMLALEYEGSPLRGHYLKMAKLWRVLADETADKH